MYDVDGDGLISGTELYNTLLGMVGATYPQAQLEQVRANLPLVCMERSLMDRFHYSFPKYCFATRICMSWPLLVCLPCHHDVHPMCTG